MITSQVTYRSPTNFNKVRWIIFFCFCKAFIEIQVYMNSLLPLKIDFQGYFSSVNYTPFNFRIYIIEINFELDASLKSHVHVTQHENDQFNNYHSHHRYVLNQQNQFLFSWLFLLAWKG